MKYSDNILNFMEEKGVSAYKLSKEIGIDQSTFSKWRKAPTSDIVITNIEKIATYFNVSVDYLLTGKERSNVELAPTPALDDDQKELLEILDNFKGRERIKFVGRCEDVAAKMLKESESSGDAASHEKLA